MTNLSGGRGSMVFSGTLSKPGTVTVNGSAAQMNPRATNFTGYASVSPGTNVLQVAATDTYGNSRTNNYQIVVTNNGVARTLSYDINGNLTSVVTASSTNTCEWDAADRLVRLTQVSTNGPQLTSEFGYDGLGRRVRVVEKQNGVAVGTNRFAWVGLALAEERDGAGAAVTKRFFGQGQQNGGLSLFYTFDHLGSVREMTDGGGAIRARYDYDPYGRRTKVQGDLEADFAFTGHYFHSVSGLCLAPYRAYDSDTGRWLSRDPIAEQGGLNLYVYVHNQPTTYADRAGLDSMVPGGNNAPVAITISGSVSGGPVTVGFQSPDALSIGGFAIAGVAAVGGTVIGTTAEGGLVAFFSGLLFEHLLERGKEAIGIGDNSDPCPGALGVTRAVQFNGRVFEGKPGELHEDIIKRLKREGKLSRGTDAWEELMSRDLDGGPWRGYMDEHGNYVPLAKFAMPPKGVPDRPPIKVPPVKR